MAYEQEKQVAIAAVQQAAQLCERVRQTLVPAAIEKNDKSPVTVADFGAQAIICRALAEAFPADPVVGEEDAADLRQPEMAAPLAIVTEQVGLVIPDASAEEVIGWIDHGNGQVSSRYWTSTPSTAPRAFCAATNTPLPWPWWKRVTSRWGCWAVRFSALMGAIAV